MRKTKCKKFIIKNFDKFEYDSKCEDNNEGKAYRLEII